MNERFNDLPTIASEPSTVACCRLEGKQSTVVSLAYPEMLDFKSSEIPTKKVPIKVDEKTKTFLYFCVLA